MAPITLITAPPIFITREQHSQFQATTPANGDFSHDPVLEHLEKAARITLEPGLEGYDAVAQSVVDVYVTESALYFLDPSTSTGFSVPYPTVSLHAISRQPILADPAVSSAHPNGTNGDAAVTEQPCVYCQLDENEGEDYDNLAEEDLAETRELSIFPSDAAAVQAIYSAMSKCASLHPSLDKPSGQMQALAGSTFADSDNDPDWSELLRQANENDGSAQAEANLTEAGRAQLARLESLIDWSSLNGTTSSVDPEEADRTSDAVEQEAGALIGEKRKR